MVDDPYKPFNDAVKNIKPDPKQPESPANPYAARDKDNVGYVMPAPRWGITGTSRQGPPGSMRYRPQFGTNYKGVKSEIEITKGDPQKDLWLHGRITTMAGYRFTLKNYDQPSSHGINQGTISKLEIRHKDTIVVNYDRGWDIKPDTPQAREALNKIMDHFDPQRRDFQPITPKSSDKDHGHGR